MRGDGSAGRRLRMLRQRTGISLRALAEQAAITPAMISCIENGKASPSVVTLEKLLAALGTDLAAFFGAEQPIPEGPVLFREKMRLIADAERSYTLVLPRAAGFGMEVLDELLQAGRPPPDFQTLPGGVAGYVISGSLKLEIEGRPAQTLRPGDAFYVPAGVSHRGFSAGPGATRLITFQGDDHAAVRVQKVRRKPHRS